MNPKHQAIIALVLMTAIWGTSFPMMKCLNLQADQYFGLSADGAPIAFRIAAAAWIIAMRFSLAFVLFLCFFRDTLRRVRRPHIQAGIAIGAMFFAGLVLQVVGLATIPASRSGFLTSLVVVFIPLISTLQRRQVPRLTVLFAGVIAMIGVSILTGLIQFDRHGISVAEDAVGRWTRGDLLTVMSAVFFSYQIVLVDTYGKRYESIAFTPSMFAATAICAWLLLFGLFFLGPRGDQPLEIRQWVSLGSKPQFWGLIAALSILPTLVAFALMNKFQPLISAVQAGIIYTLEPVFASAFAMFLPGILSALCVVSYANESFTLPLLIGGALVIAANVIALKPKKGSGPNSR